MVTAFDDYSAGRATAGRTAEKTTVSTGPLEGLRVIELGSIVAGPYAGRLLADYGADVIKVEAPGRPDPLRDWGQESYKSNA